MSTYGGYMPHGGPPIDDRPDPEADQTRRVFWRILIVGLSVLFLLGGVNVLLRPSPFFGG